MLAKHGHERKTLLINLYDLEFEDNKSHQNVGT